MAKINCYYIGKGYGSKKIETPTFKAYKYKDKEKNETILYPITDEKAKEVFIRGVGWKKISKSTKLVDVPVFDGEEAHWDDYIEKYGVYCLYYSLDGEDYNFNDCSRLPKATEIRSIIYTGVKGYAKFMELYHRMNNLQRKVIEEKYLADIDYNKWSITNIEDYIFAPQYYLEYTFIPHEYSPDILKDDMKLVALWKDYRSGYLRRNSKWYQEYLSFESKRKEVFNKWQEERNNSTLEAEFRRLEGCCHNAFMKAEKEINERISIELDTDNNIFPTSVKERMRLIYGNEVVAIYDELIDKYLKTKEERCEN